MVVGACLCHLALSWAPLWRVEPPNGRLTEMRFGSFWGFLEDVPRAIQSFAEPGGPENVPANMPGLCLWGNVRTTLLVAVAGAALGAMIWWGARWCEVTLLDRATRGMPSGDGRSDQRSLHFREI